MMRALYKKCLVGVSAAVFTLLATTEGARAFCGFYVAGGDRTMFNDATQVVMMREGTRTVLAMQNAYEGPPENFALVIPVPVVLQKENVKTLGKDVFAKVDQMSSPRLVEYWEQDPCPMRRQSDEGAERSAPRSMAKGAGAAAPMATTALVRVEARFEVGEYEIVILSADDSSALEKWLREEKYSLPPGAEPYLRPYVAEGSKFFVAKVDPTKLTFQNGKAVLSPLRFHYDTEKFNLPVRLGLLNSKGQQDLIVHIFAPNQRFVAANYPNVTIPTNLEVTDKTKDEFPAFYTSLFSKTVEENPKAVVTEYSWSAASCDPCPGPTLSQSELASLGADALPSARWGAPGQLIGDPVKVDAEKIAQKGGVTAVDGVVNGMRPRIRACYAMARGRNPSLASIDADVKLDVDKTGEVKSATVAMKATEGGAPVVDSVLDACLVNALKRTTFGKTESANASVTARFKLVAPPAPDPSAPKVLLSIPYNLVHTRLHARYTKESLGEDLIFAHGEAIVGGREVMNGDKLESGATPVQSPAQGASRGSPGIAMPSMPSMSGGAASTFQGRYIIRHKWEGAVACANPRFGVWGGPPGDPYGIRPQNPNVAANLAFAPPSKKVQVASYMRDPSTIRFAGPSAVEGPIARRVPKELEGSERFGYIWTVWLGILLGAMFIAGRQGKTPPK